MGGTCRGAMGAERFEWARLLFVLLCTSIAHSALAATGIGVVLLQRPGGVMIEKPIQGSTAELAGIRPEDVIIAVNGAPVTAAEEVSSLVPSEEGTTVHLTILRGEDPQPIEVDVVRGPGGERVGSIGVLLTARSDGLVEVLALATDGMLNAWLAGMRREDVLVGVDGAPVRSVEDAEQRLQGPMGTNVVVTVVRPGSIQAQYSYVVRRLLPIPRAVSDREKQFEDEEFRVHAVHHERRRHHEGVPVRSVGARRRVGPRSRRSVLADEPSVVRQRQGARAGSSREPSLALRMRGTSVRASRSMPSAFK